MSIAAILARPLASCDCGLRYCTRCYPDVYPVAKPFPPHPRGRIMPDYKSRRMKVTWLYRVPPLAAS